MPTATIGWSLIYLAITASLVGVLGVLGPDFAKETLGLERQGLRGRRPAARVRDRHRDPAAQLLRPNTSPRRRVIEGGLIVLGILLAALAAAGPISRFLQRADAPGGLDLSGVTSLLAVVVVIAFFAGIAYGLVAIPSQTQLQEDLPEDVRGRVFGVLGMLVSVASFLPIIIVGPISDLVGTTAVIFVDGRRRRGHRGGLGPDPRAAAETEAHPRPTRTPVDPIASALGADRPTWHEHVATTESPPTAARRRTDPAGRRTARRRRARRRTPDRRRPAQTRPTAT